MTLHQTAARSLGSDHSKTCRDFCGVGTLRGRPSDSGRKLWDGIYGKQGGLMPQAIQLEIEMPGDLAKFRLPKGVAKRLQDLLDKQDSGEQLTTAEGQEAAGLVDLAEVLSLLRLRAQCSRKPV